MHQSYSAAQSSLLSEGNVPSVADQESTINQTRDTYEINKKNKKGFFNKFFKRKNKVGDKSTEESVIINQSEIDEQQVATSSGRKLK